MGCSELDHRNPLLTPSCKFCALWLPNVRLQSRPHVPHTPHSRDFLDLSGWVYSENLNKGKAEPWLPGPHWGVSHPCCSLEKKKWVTLYRFLFLLHTAASLDLHSAALPPPPLPTLPPRSAPSPSQQLSGLLAGRQAFWLTASLFSSQQPWESLDCRNKARSFPALKFQVAPSHDTEGETRVLSTSHEARYPAGTCPPPSAWSPPIFCLFLTVLCTCEFPFARIFTFLSANK